MTTELFFHLERETKGALRYQERTLEGQTKGQDRVDDYVIGTLYVRKAGVQGTPRVLRVTLEAHSE